MKKLYKGFLLTLLAVLLALSSSACIKTEDEPTEVTEDFPAEDIAEEEEDYDNGIYFDEEGEFAEINTEKVSQENFYGSWTATSGKAMYLFGNFDITIKSDGSWSGNIADEPLKGKWVQNGDGLSLTSELFDFDLAFTKEGALVMKHVPDDDYEESDPIIIVLTKK